MERQVLGVYSIEDCGVVDTLEVFRVLRGFDVQEYLDKKRQHLYDYMLNREVDVCIIPVDGTLGAEVVFAMVKFFGEDSGSPIKGVVPVSVSDGILLVEQCVNNYESIGLYTVVLTGRDLNEAFCSDGYPFDNISLISDIYRSETEQLAAYFSISINEQFDCQIDGMPVDSDLIEFNLELFRYRGTGIDIMHEVSKGKLNAGACQQAVAWLSNRELLDYDSRLALWDVGQPGGWLI